MTAPLELRRLTKRFHAFNAVDDVSLTVAAGEFVAVLGPSGSGKTTMLRLLAGFDMPSSGAIIIGGRDVSGLAPGERNIGMVFQHYALFPHLTVARNIGYGLKMHGWDAERRKARVGELLAMIRLESAGERLPHQLSGGQQQRVAIARALAYSPSVLLMDEPLGALDRALRMEMTEEIRRIHRALGTTFIYVTHDRDEAMTLADRIIVMQKGRIDADGTPEQLFERPPTAFVAEFFSGMNVMPAQGLGLGSGQVAVAPGNILFARPAGAAASVPATVKDRLFLGERHVLILTSPACPQPLRAYVPTRSPAPDIGAVVDIFIPEDALIALP